MNGDPERIDDRPINVLVVDDDHDVLLAIEAVLAQKGGFQVKATYGFTAATHWLALGHIDLLIADVVLPGQASGVALAHNALRNHPHISLVIISAETPLEEPYPWRAVYLRKPFGALQLLDAINESRARVRRVRSGP